jgi:hypothetical protein
MYGVVSMDDGYYNIRHYSGLGETCGKMMVSITTPVLNIMDAIWVSHASLKGYPESTTKRTNQIIASQDPVALDYWAAKYILYPIDNNSRHHPEFASIDIWLQEAKDIINERGGLRDPDKGILIGQVTKNEEEMQVSTHEVEISGSIESPLNFSAKKVLNRSLFMAEYINVLTWESNPSNENIVEYRIYELENGYQNLLAAITSGTYEYWQRNVQKNKMYSYALAAVNDQGQEGRLAYSTVQ